MYLKFFHSAKHFFYKFHRSYVLALHLRIEFIVKPLPHLLVRKQSPMSTPIFYFTYLHRNPLPALYPLSNHATLLLS